METKKKFCYLGCFLEVCYICKTNLITMKTKIIYVFWVCLFLPLTLWAEHRDLGSLLKELDAVIDRKDTYTLPKEQELSALRMLLNQAKDDRQKYELCNKLYTGYLHYQADSAWAYVERKQALFPMLNDPMLEQELVINRAEVMGVMGMYSWAEELLSQVKSETLSPELLGYYYRTVRANYGWFADYLINKELKEIYEHKAHIYRDSIMLTTKPGTDHDIVAAEKLMVEGDVDEALDMLCRLSENNPDLRQQAFINYTLAEAYDLRGEVDNQIYRLALTAIADLKFGTREYASLQKLAYLLYDKGDVDRAYKYLTCSMDDAVACNARLRFSEVTEFFPIVDKAYKLKEERGQTIRYGLLFFSSFLSLALIVGVFWLYRWNKKLSLMRQHLSQTNDQLRLVNKELAQTGKIKEAYIAHYLELCVTYLDNLESYRRSLAKLAMASRIDDLFKAIKSDQFLKDERKDFYHNFDKSFLELFPHFIESFNALLVDDGHIYPKSNELLSTELRIFALIRLGVTDSNAIAHFLGYSLATVYNYRSRAKSRAKGNKETFEQEVMNL